MATLFYGSYFECRAFCHEARAAYDGCPAPQPQIEAQRFTVEEVRPPAPGIAYPEYQIVPVDRAVSAGIDAALLFLAQLPKNLTNDALLANIDAALPPFGSPESPAFLAAWQRTLDSARATVARFAATQVA